MGCICSSKKPEISEPTKVKYLVDVKQDNLDHGHTLQVN